VIRAAVRWLGFAVVATIGMIVARQIWPGRQELELDVFVLALGTLGLIVVASEVTRIAPPAEESLLEEALDPEPPEERPILELNRLDRELTMGSTRAFDLHYRLRPVLREIASARLEQRGLVLDSGSPAVQDALGEEVWELIAPDREPPDDRLAPGAGLEKLDRTITRLERL
jgi:hypothetical protein